MIIKKRKKPNDGDNNPNRKQAANNNSARQSAAMPMPEINSPEPLIKERQERRRGDRRRGYRRIDDRNLISRAQEEANAIKESAAREGFEYGVKISRDELTRLNQSINEILSAKDQALQESVPDIASVAVKAAEKLIKKQLEIDETIVLNVVADVIKSFGKSESSITIRVNPNDIQIVQDNIPKIYPYGSSKTKIEVMGDEEVDWGSCIVETQNGIIDAKFSTQLIILQKALETEL